MCFTTPSSSSTSSPTSTTMLIVLSHPSLKLSFMPQTSNTFYNSSSSSSGSEIVLCTRWSLSSFMAFFHSRTLCNSRKKYSRMSGGYLVHRATFPLFPAKCSFDLVAPLPQNFFTQYLHLNLKNKFYPCSHTTSLSPSIPATMDETKQMYHTKFK
jgi:hypothetical protein